MATVKATSWPCDANALPVERGGDLQRDVGERGFAVVAHGDEGADGDVLLGGAQMHVHIEVGEGDGLALGVGGDGRVDRFAAGRGLRRGPAVVVVWPFSSVEREKMTLPWGCSGPAAAEGVGLG